MEVSCTDRPDSPGEAISQQVALKRVSGESQNIPVTPISTATAISPLTSDNNSFVDLPPQALVYDSISRQTTPAYDSSTTCLTPTTSSASDFDPIVRPDNDSGEGFKTPTKSSRATFSIVLKNWKWEIAACGLVLVVPAIMVATVFPHRNQPIPQWPFKISINAMLAIYTLVFKSAIAYVVTSCVGQLQWAWFSSGSRPLSDAILFDDAGRSPWGLLAILWAHRLRQPLTILAAIIMISGLAIDPFISNLSAPLIAVFLLSTSLPLCLAQTKSTWIHAPGMKSKSQTRCFALRWSQDPLHRALKYRGIARRGTAHSLTCIALWASALPAKIYQLRPWWN